MPRLYQLVGSASPEQGLLTLDVSPGVRGLRLHLRIGPWRRLRLAAGDREAAPADGDPPAAGAAGGQSDAATGAAISWGSDLD